MTENAKGRARLITLVVASALFMENLDATVIAIFIPVSGWSLRQGNCSSQTFKTSLPTVTPLQAGAQSDFRKQAIDPALG